MPWDYHSLGISRADMLKYVTDRKEKSRYLDPLYKDKAQKILFKAQHPLIKNIYEYFKLNNARVIINPIGFKYSGRGDTLYELHFAMADMEQSLDLGLFDGSEVARPVTAPKPKPAVPPKPSGPKEEMIAVPKHILPPEELDGVVSALISQLGLQVQQTLSGASAIEKYIELRRQSKVMHNDETVVVSDSYAQSQNPRIQDKDVPNVIECIVTSQRKVTSRSEWIQLIQGQQPYNVRPKEEELLQMQGRKYKSGKKGRGQYKFVTKAKTGVTAGKPHRTKRTNKSTNPSRGEIPKKLQKSNLSRKSRYGGPEGKKVRTTQNATRTYDEIAVYARAEVSSSKITRKKRKWGGHVEYFFFKIIPKETKIPKSVWEKKYGNKNEKI